MYFIPIASVSKKFTFIAYYHSISITVIISLSIVFQTCHLFLLLKLSHWPWSQNAFSQWSTSFLIILVYVLVVFPCYSAPSTPSICSADPAGYTKSYSFICFDRFLYVFAPSLTFAFTNNTWPFLNFMLNFKQMLAFSYFWLSFFVSSFH